jgi:hypothetical protein
MELKPPFGPRVNSTIPQLTAFSPHVNPSYPSNHKIAASMSPLTVVEPPGNAD